MTDVLVVGGGLAGCWAAIRARELTEKVTLVEKAVVARSGATVFTNSMLAPPKEEEIPLWTAEIAEAGTWFSDQEWVRTLLQEQQQRVADLVSWGMAFERSDTGALATSLARAHRSTRVIMFNGHELMDLMRRKVLEKGVQLKQRVMVIDLLTSDGRHPTRDRVIGAMGLDTVTGKVVTFLANAVVVTTGMIESKLRASYINNLTGDGPAMAYRAGAEVVGMEFILNNHINAFDGKYWTGGSSLLQGLGARFINKDGEEFVGRLSRELGNRTRLSWTCLAMEKERLEGRGPVYLDMRSFSPEKLALIKKVLPTQWEPFERGNINLGEHPLEMNPVIGLNSCGQGGVKIDRSYQSSLPGLYLAGSAAYNAVHGTYAMGGINLAWCNVSGFRAGESAATYARYVPVVKPREPQLSELRQLYLAPLSNKEGNLPDQVFGLLHRIIMPPPVSQFRTESSLKKALERIELLAAQPVFAPDAHELIKAQEARNLVQLARLTLHAALLRQESRDSHYRQDYPYRDDVNWLKLIVTSKRDMNDLSTRFEAIPIWRYPNRPQELRQIPFPVKFALKKEEDQDEH